MKFGSPTRRLGYIYLPEDTSAFTKEKGNDLKAGICKISEETNAYRSKTTNSLWLEDLKCLEEAF